MARTKNPYVPDEELDAEIARLRQSPDVRLAEKYKRVMNRRRIYLYELRASEKRGRELREQGITEETLDGAYGCDDE